MWLVVGLVVGAAAASLVWAWLTRVSVRRARRAEQRAQTNERLAELGSMTGGLAHEIRNPLSTIGLNLQLLMEALADAPLDTAERTRLLRRAGSVNAEVDRLAGILQDFLEYAGALHLEPAPCDLNGVLEELADFFAPQADRAGVRLRVEPATRSAVALVDARATKQAAMNLMLNALHAMKASAGESSGANGELILRATEARLADGRPAIAVHVIDTGPGIPERLREEIFRPYVTTKSGGSGLGLPTTRRIVEAHGGELRLDTEEGRGSDFSMVFPASGAGSGGQSAPSRIESVMSPKSV